MMAPRSFFRGCLVGVAVVLGTLAVLLLALRVTSKSFQRILLRLFMILQIVPRVSFRLI